MLILILNMLELKCSKYMIIKTHNIVYEIIAGFCGRLKHCASKEHLCNFETIVP